MPEPKQLRVLLAVADDKASSTLRAYLRARDDVAEIASAGNLLDAIRTGRPHMVCVSMEAGGHTVAALRRSFPELAIVAVAPPISTIAFAAARQGAAELLTLPLDAEGIATRLGPILDRLAGEPGDEELRTDAPAGGLPRLISSSPRMAAIRDTIEKVASTTATVLIRGESGVGKEVVARMIFERSGRKQRPFVKVNCAAIPDDLLESELFGYEAGAFTGAQRSKPGKFELADGGTLFLDEIGEMHPALQAKLLHVLQDGEFARLGSRRDTAVDARVLCATNKLLEQRVTEGLFREDLFYRINVVTVHIPPLRERRDEIPVLLNFFIDRYTEVYARSVAPLSEEVMRFLVQYSWPGNIRELENLCKRYVIVGGATQIVAELAARKSEPDTVTKPEVKREATPPTLLEIGRQAAWLAERQAIREMLLATRWNRREAAKRLGVSYKALLNRIRQMEEVDGVGD
jgi:two-component system, NtrC family, response regulator AtoC